MRKLVKRLLLAGAALLVLLVAGAWLGINHLAKKGLEAGGSTALGVSVQAGKVSLSPFSSSVTLARLQIGNPAGYQTDRLLALDYGRVACDLPSLFTREARLRDIALEAPELTIELRPGVSPRSNLGDLLQALDAEKEQRAKSPAAAKSQQSLRVERLRVTGTRVRFHLLGGRTVDAVLPDIELTDVKNADGSPLLLADLLRQLLGTMAAQAFAQTRGRVPDDLLTAFGRTLGTAAALLPPLRPKKEKR
jgi:hypothetical protein